MGYNTSVIVLNDALSCIERDPDFGKKLVRAISGLGFDEPPCDVSALGHCNAATAIETHHADMTSIVAFGGNYGTRLHSTWGSTHHTPEAQERLLCEWADSLGFRLVRKAQRKPQSRNRAATA